jgi:PAS domain S-box-containing protein
MIVNSGFRATSMAFLRTQQVCALIAVGLAALARLGWMLGWHSAASLGPSSIAMARSTALAFLLLGLALLLLTHPPWARWKKGTAVLCGGLICLLSAFRLYEFLAGQALDTRDWDLPLPFELIESVAQDQMALQTAITFLLASIAVLVLTWSAGRPSVRSIIGLLAVAVTALGLVFALSYLYEAPFSSAETIPMALNTALGGIALGVGLLASAGPEATPLRLVIGPSIQARLLRAFLPFTVLIVCLVAWLMHYVSQGQTASITALFAAVLVVAALFPVGFITRHITRSLGGDLEQAAKELRQAEKQSRTYADELKALNASLEQRVAERTAALAESQDHLEQFFAIITSLQDPDVERTFDLVLGFCQRLGYEQAMLSLVDREARVVRAVRAVGTLAQIVERTVRPLDGGDILAIVVRDGRTAVIPDSREDPRCDQAAIDAANIRGQVIVPLVSGGNVVGTLQVAARTTLNVAPEAVRTLETLGGQAARALARQLRQRELQRLYHELEARNQQLQELANDLEASVLSERQAHEALRASEARLQAILDNSTAVVYLKDTESRFLLINRRFEELFHVTRELVQGKDNHDLFPKEWADAFRANDLKVLETHRPIVFEEVAPQDDGNHTYISIKFPLYTAQGTAYGVCGISTDITDRKRAEEQLQQQNLRLEEMARSEREAHETLKKAQSQMVQAEKLAALGQLVAGVAHEINNPLSYVSNNLAVLQRDVFAVRDLLNLYQEAKCLVAEHRPDLGEGIHRLAARIDLPYTLANLDGLMARSRDGLKRIQHIVKDLRDFARLDESDLHEVDLNEGIESTVNIIRGQARNLDVALELHLAPLPPVTCYPAKINQVVLNLVANALDACSAGGKVKVSTRRNGNRVELDVEDTGSGIDPAIRDRIFDPFFTTKPQGKGTGLGLSISYGIVRAHGGTINFDSTPGQGTCFHVRLPLKVPAGGER